MSAEHINNKPTIDQSGFPFAKRVNQITLQHPIAWLKAGWRDFRTAGWISVIYSLVVVLSGMAVSLGSYLMDMSYLIAPLSAGFVLIAPLFAVGFYDVSRRLETHDTPTLKTTFTAWRSNPVRFLGAGLALVFFMIIWMRTAALIYFVSFPYTSPNLTQLINMSVTTSEGLSFLAVGSVIGCVLATFAFLLSAVSLQMMMQEKTDFLPAILTSISAVIKNFKPMVFWAALIVLLTFIGILTAFIGLIIVMPLLGHASWHAYRDLIAIDETNDHS